MTTNKDSPEVIKFMHLFGKLKDLSEDDPESLPALASADDSIKDLCLKLLKAAGSIQKDERGERELFAAPVDSKLISTWRDFEKRYAHLLLIVRSNEVKEGKKHILLSFDWYEQPPRWEDADDKAARAAELIETMISGEIVEALINFTGSQVSGDTTGASTTETFDWTPINTDAIPKEFKELLTEAYAFRNELVKKIQLSGDEAQKSELKNKLIDLAEWGIDDHGVRIEDAVKWARADWKRLKDEAGFDLRGVLRRRALVPFVLFPRHVAAQHGQAEMLSIYENLRQAHEAFIFGAPSAALALMRSILEIVLRDHYGAQGDLQLYERINRSRRLLPSSANAEALHRLRMIANAVLHLDNETKEAVPKLGPIELEKEILRLLRVLRDLIEGAPSKADIAATTASNQRGPR
jgi:Domain of unknown function (DUF4145)